MIRNGLPWRDAPSKYAPRKAIYNRVIDWSHLGAFNQIFAELTTEGGKPDQLMIDASQKAAALLGDKGYGANWLRADLPVAA